MQNQILTTNDYSIFRKMNGNRGVDEKRVNGLMKSIRKIGWISNPIIVNKKMEVVDGQGRLEALKRLAMPVEYHIVDGANLEACRVMNTNNKAWKPIDYITSYADSGIKDYQRIKDIVDHYHVSVDTVILSSGKNSSGATTEAIRNGTFEFSEDDYNNACQALDIREKYLSVLDKFGGRRTTRDKVVFYLVEYGKVHPGVDHDKIIEALESCDPHEVYAQNFERLLESIQDVYNYNKRKGGRLYFYEEYRLDNHL